MINAIFFLSGVSALIFENIWFRQAGIVFGNGVWATSLVLSSFMTGLSVGNAAAVLYPIGREGALRRYALLELVVASTGVGLVLLLPVLGESLVPALGLRIESGVTLDAIRFAAAFALLVVPTAAMGMTLPVLVGEASPKNLFGVTLGRLYGWNTLGAVVGAVAGEALLYEHLGLRGAGFLAGGLNLTAAALSLGLARRRLREPAEGARASLPSIAWGRREIQLLAVGAIAGGVFLSLEVVWTRFLLLFVFGTALTFSIMLAVTLAGLALGGLLAARASGLTAAPTSVPVLALLGGIAVTSSYAAFNEVLNLDVSFLGGGPGLRLVVIAAALILPSALVSGALFTSIGVALARTLEPSRATGLLALFNTAGGAVGAMVAGFGLLPFLGMERSFLILAVWYGLAAAGSPAAWSRLRRSRALILATATFLIFVVLFPLGLMERTYLRRALWPFVKPGSSSQVLAFREGTTETITYVGQMFEGEVVSTRLVTNGFSMSGTFFEGRRYMEAFVYLPVAIHPHVRRALLVSYGVGATARALSQTPEIEHIDVVDISSDILDLAPMAFPPPEVSPLSDPRVTTHVEDGRFFLHTATEPYDLITSEPPPPHLGGVVNLYTQEYFALVKRQLNPGGVVSYWLPVASLSDDDARAISSAFCEVFDDCTLWKGMNLDWILIGTNGMKTAVSAERFRAQWAPGGPRDLRSLGFEEPEQLGALFMGDRRSIPDLASAKPLTDNYPGRLSRTPPPTPPFGEWRRRLMDSAACRQRFEASDFIRAVWPEDIRSATLPYFAIQGVYDEMVEALLGRRGSNTAADAVRLMRETPLQVLPAILLGSSPDLQILAKRVAGRGGVEAAWFHAHQAVVDLTARRFSPAIDHFRSALRLDPSFPGLTERLTLALCMDGRVSEANAEQHRAGLDGEWSAILQSACAPGSTRLRTR